MEWQRFAVRALRHPKLKALKAFKYRKACEFLALSCEYGKVGVVDLYDDEIRAELDMSMAQWLDLRDEMILRGIVRQVERSDGSHHYEVAMWLLPKQASVPGVFVDSRIDEVWGEPEILVEGDTKDRKSNGWSGADRQAWLRYQRRCLRQGTPMMAREEYLQQRYDAKSPEFAGTLPVLSSPQTPPAVTDSAPKPVTETDPVTGFFDASSVTASGKNVTARRDGDARAEQQQSQREEQKNNNRAERSRESVTAAVTENPEKSVTPVIVEEALRAEDIDAKTASRLVEEKGLFACTQQLIYWPYRKAEFLKRDGREPEAGMLRRSIEDGWGPPRGWKSAQNERRGEEARRAKREAEAARVRQAEQDGEARRARLAGFWLSLEPEEQAEIDATARENLPAILRSRTGPAAACRLEEEREKILVAKMQEGSALCQS
jgi:hypothetical protein